MYFSMYHILPKMYKILVSAAIFEPKYISLTCYLMIKFHTEIRKTYLASDGLL